MGKRRKSQKGEMRNPKRRHTDMLSNEQESSGMMILKQKKAKIISCDDLPKRKAKHEVSVIAEAEIKSEDNVTEDSGDDFYNKVKQLRAAKLAAKAEMYSRKPATSSLPETADGKRSITYQMEKNRGLTRSRNKQLKNPRNKYKINHQKAVIRRKGQVRDIRKPQGPYGGETTGINVGISRSIRFKN